MPDTVEVCRTCRRAVSPDLFIRNSAKRSGYELQCRDCERARMALRRKSGRLKGSPEPTVSHKGCSHCGRHLPADAFSRNAANVNGLSSWCRECLGMPLSRERPPKNAGSTRVHRPQRTPEQHAARSAVYNAIKSGRLRRMPCSVCGTTLSVEAHHPDYAKRLEVIWLCRTHHARLHVFLLRRQKHPLASPPKILAEAIALHDSIAAVESTV